MAPAKPPVPDRDLLLARVVAARHALQKLHRALQDHSVRAESVLEATFLPLQEMRENKDREFRARELDRVDKFIEQNRPLLVHLVGEETLRQQALLRGRIREALAQRPQVEAEREPWRQRLKPLLELFPCPFASLLEQHGSDAEAACCHALGNRWLVRPPEDSHHAPVRTWLSNRGSGNDCSPIQLFRQCPTSCDTCYYRALDLLREVESFLGGSRETPPDRMLLAEIPAAGSTKLISTAELIACLVLKGQKERTIKRSLRSERLAGRVTGRRGHHRRTAAGDAALE